MSSVRRDGDGGRGDDRRLEGRIARFAQASCSPRVASPNVEALRLDELGIEHDRARHRRRRAHAHVRRGIWAAGDVTGRYQFTPIAQYQARIAVDDMFGRDRPRADYSVLPTAIFTEPELAGVGLTEQEAREQGVDHEVVTHDIKHVQRASYKDQKRGLYKIVFDPSTRRVLGLHVVAPNGGDIVQGLSLGLRLGATVDDLASMHHVFPTFGEGVKAAAEQAMPQPRRDGRDLQLIPPSSERGRRQSALPIVRLSETRAQHRGNRLSDGGRHGVLVRVAQFRGARAPVHERSELDALDAGAGRSDRRAGRCLSDRGAPPNGGEAVLQGGGARLTRWIPQPGEGRSSFAPTPISSAGTVDWAELAPARCGGRSAAVQDGAAASDRRGVLDIDARPGLQEAKSCRPEGLQDLTNAPSHIDARASRGNC